MHDRQEQIGQLSEWLHENNDKNKKERAKLIGRVTPTLMCCVMRTTTARRVLRFLMGMSFLSAREECLYLAILWEYAAKCVWELREYFFGLEGISLPRYALRFTNAIRVIVVWS